MSYKPYPNVEKLIADRCWDKAMRAGGVDGYGNYSGPSYAGYVIAYSTSRDSDIMNQSNYDTFLSELGKSPSVIEVTASHWGCGWVKTIMVKKTAKAKLKIVMDCLNALADYPLLDDTDYYEREQEKADEDYEFHHSDFERNLLKYLGRDIHDEDIDASP